MSFQEIPGRKKKGKLYRESNVKKIIGGNPDKFTSGVAKREITLEWVE